MVTRRGKSFASDGRRGDDSVCTDVIIVRREPDMDPDSLDWIWEDLDNPSGDPAEGIVESFVDDDDYGLYDGPDGDGSDGGSDSDAGCSLLIRDQKTAQEVYAIIDDIKRRYGRGDEDEADDRSDPTTAADDGRLGDREDDDDEESAVGGFYADAVEAATTLLSEVQLAWADTLHRCTVNE